MNIQIDPVDGLPYQEFNNKVYKLYTGAKYFSRGPKSMHRVVYSFYNGPIPKGYHVHHKNHNRWDNSKGNLVLVESKKHLAKHMKQRVKDNPEWFKKFQKSGQKKAKAWHSSEEGMTWHKEHAKKQNFGNLTYGKRKCIVCSTAFEAKLKAAKFCSNKCKSQHRRNMRVDDVARKCIVCKQTFMIDKHAGTKTCGHSCAAKQRWVDRR